MTRGNRSVYVCGRCGIAVVQLPGEEPKHSRAARNWDRLCADPPAVMRRSGRPATQLA